MKHKVGYAVYFKGILDNKFTLDRIYLNPDSAIKRMKTLFQMFGYEGKVEKTWIMVEEDWKAKYDALCDCIESVEGWDPREEED